MTGSIIDFDQQVLGSRTRPALRAMALERLRGCRILG